MNWEIFIPKLHAVVSQHLGHTVDPEDYWKDDSPGMSIYKKWSAANAVQTIDRSDRDPQKDKESLIKASKQIGMAANNFRDVGWHGDQALNGVLALAVDQSGENYTMELRDAMEAVTRIADHLDRLSKEIIAASETINLEADSVLGALSDGSTDFIKSPGRSREIVARSVAAECANLYLQYTGKNPTVITPFNGGPAYGPFLDFVGETFKALSITASPEAHAREAKEKIPARQ